MNLEIIELQEAARLYVVLPKTPSREMGLMERPDKTYVQDRRENLKLWKTYYNRLKMFYIRIGLS